MPTKDYLVDLIALRSSMHEINDVFTDPSKVKSVSRRRF